MRGFIFRISGAVLCLTVLLCACQKDGDEVTTTNHHGCSYNASADHNDNGTCHNNHNQSVDNRST